MLFVSTKAVLVRKRRRTFGAHKPKASLCKRRLITARQYGKGVRAILLVLLLCFGRKTCFMEGIACGVFFFLA